MTGTTYTQSIKRYKNSEKGRLTHKNYVNRPDVKEKRDIKRSLKYHDLEGWKRYRLADIKHRAKRRGLEFNLTLDDLIIPIVCPVFGTPLRINYGRRGLGSRDAPSVDRIDNTKGYTKDNIVIMSNRANVLKKDGTLKEFEKIVEYLRRLKSQ